PALVTSSSAAERPFAQSRQGNQMSTPIKANGTRTERIATTSENRALNTAMIGPLSSMARKPIKAKYAIFPNTRAAACTAASPEESMLAESPYCSGKRGPLQVYSPALNGSCAVQRENPITLSADQRANERSGSSPRRTPLVRRQAPRQGSTPCGRHAPAHCACRAAEQ